MAFLIVFLTMFFLNPGYILISGFLFSIIVAITLKGPPLKKTIFVLTSVAIYILAFYVSLINAYWGPKQEQLIMGSMLGAILEILNFTIVFKLSSKLSSKLKFSHLLFGVLVGAIAFVDRSEEGIIVGFAVWTIGIALIIYNIAKTDETRTNPKSPADEIPNQRL